MKSDPNAYRPMFYSAAAFNWMASLLLLFGGNLFWGLLATPEPAERVWFQLLVAMVALFGWGYFAVAQDPVRNRIMALLGCVGKTTVFVVVLAHVLTSGLSERVLMLVTVDLVYAALFARFLINTR